MIAPVRLGMVGGGEGAFIGAVHRIAARMDGRFQLLAGALSSDPPRARASAEGLGLARSYDTWAQMAQAEAARPDGIEAVAIVTPNHLHAGPSAAFLAAGIHVICDKPLAATAQDAARIAETARAASARFFVTHTYAGYPMIREARAIVAEGGIGDLRAVQVDYLQDWLARDPGTRQSDWRLDPARAGAGALGDIGTHAFHLAGFVSGAQPSHLAAEVSALVPGRRIDDDARVMLRYPGGARGGIWVSQVAVGCENRLALRLFGSAGGLEWCQSAPDQLIRHRLGQPSQLLTRAQDRSNSARTPPGHPEGYLEAFANIYRDIADVIRGDDSVVTRIPGLADGLAGMGFIAAARASTDAGGAWVGLAS